MVYAARSKRAAGSGTAPEVSPVLHNATAADNPAIFMQIRGCAKRRAEQHWGIAHFIPVARKIRNAT